MLHKSRYPSIARQVIEQTDQLTQYLTNGDWPQGCPVDEYELARMHDEIARDATAAMALTRNLWDAEIAHYELAVQHLNT
jgi:hypothetical protein